MSLQRNFHSVLSVPSALMIFALVASASTVAAGVESEFTSPSPTTPVNPGGPVAVDDYEYEYDDNALVLATLVQSNSNVIEFIANPELGELTMWETGTAADGGPVFDDENLAQLTMLERFLLLAPSGTAVPESLIRFGKGDVEEAKSLTRGRLLVETLPGTIDIGGHYAALPALTRAACTNIYSGPWDWWEHRSSGCNVDGKSPYVKARICNKSNWGSITMQLGYKHFCSSSGFVYPSSKRKDVAAGSYGVVEVNSVNRCRRARYVNWDAYYESALVGGWFTGSVTSDNCDF